MSDTYTPTTEEVERACVRSIGPARFYAWLAAHDADVAAIALEEAASADEVFSEHVDVESYDFNRGVDHGANVIFDKLRARAAEYRKAVQ